MQVFLPYEDFVQTAKALDYRRLGKQRVECKQILNVLLGLTEGKGWVNHPATKMWRGYEGALAWYGYVICREWRSRGYKDTLMDFFQYWSTARPRTNPPWLGREDIHASHRSNLLRKDAEFYSKHGWTEPHDLPYIWE